MKTFCCNNFGARECLPYLLKTVDLSLCQSDRQKDKSHLSMTDRWTYQLRSKPLR